MIKQGYYVFAPMEAGCIGPYSGIEKKIRAQCSVFEKYFDIKLNILPVVSEQSRFRRYASRLPFVSIDRKWKYDGEYTGADFLYIRQVRHDRAFINYLKDIRNQNHDMKIIYEIPTYPYDDESKTTIKNVHLFLKDRYNRKKLKKYVDRIVTFYDNDEIFGISTLKIQNGFDFSSFSCNTEPLCESAINIIEVSTTAFWHGYDRFIEGLGEYYKNGGKENVVFHMVGYVSQEMKNLAEKYHLDNHIVFHGLKSGEALEKIYNSCSLGVDVLGGHRKNYPLSSSLKSREYAARGIPVVTASPVDYMPENYKYQLLEPYDDSPIDINGVLSFYHSVYDEKDIGKIRNEIRIFAQEKCDIQKTLMPVIDYINNQER